MTSPEKATAADIDWSVIGPPKFGSWDWAKAGAIMVSLYAVGILAGLQLDARDDARLQAELESPNPAQARQAAIADADDRFSRADAELQEVTSYVVQRAGAACLEDIEAVDPHLLYDADDRQAEDNRRDSVLRIASGEACSELGVADIELLVLEVAQRSSEFFNAQLHQENVTARPAEDYVRDDLLSAAELDGYTPILGLGGVVLGTALSYTYIMKKDKKLKNAAENAVAKVLHNADPRLKIPNPSQPDYRAQIEEGIQYNASRIVRQRRDELGFFRQR